MFAHLMILKDFNESFTYHFHEFFTRGLLFSEEKNCVMHIIEGTRAHTSNVIGLKVALSAVSTFNSTMSKFIRT